MKQVLLSETGHHRLTLFFAGWGMDETPFADYQPNSSDLMICYDYRDMYFNKKLIEGYDHIRVIGWSMGIWAAPITQKLSDLCINETIAINGSLTPVDDEKGIPTAIFEGTLKGLNEATLQKFYRRMCGTAEVYQKFRQVTPQRPIEELKEELCTIGMLSRCLPIVGSSFYDKIFVGNQDRIFPPANQIAGYSNHLTDIETVDAAHYDPPLFRHIFQSHG